jgi:beta-glucosidase
VDHDVVHPCGPVVGDPVASEVAIIRLAGPSERRLLSLEALFHRGSLGFAPEVVERIVEIAALVAGMVDVSLDRPVSSRRSTVW